VAGEEIKNLAFGFCGIIRYNNKKIKISEGDL
jgi:hypothetical protein